MKQDVTVVEPVVSNNNQKKGNKKGRTITTVIAIVVAICGIGFGVFGIIRGWDKDDQISSLEAQINKANNEIVSLETQVEEANNKIESLKNNTTEQITTTRSKNQLIMSGAAPVVYNVNFEARSGDSSILLSVRKGEVDYCKYGSGGYVNKECSIKGLTGKIYKVAEISEGQDRSDKDSIGFIMEDGSVEYLYLNDALERGDFNIDGKLKIDGVVTDIISIGVGVEDGIGGYGSTVFVLANGDYMLYDESLFE